eukprot:8510662-Pyramimonas_sp.AAC.1
MILRFPHLRLRLRGQHLAGVVRVQRQLAGGEGVHVRHHELRPRRAQRRRRPPPRALLPCQLRPPA